MRRVRLSLGLAASAAALALAASTAMAAPTIAGPTDGAIFGPTAAAPNELPAAYTLSGGTAPYTWTETGTGTATPASGAGPAVSVTAVSADGTYTLTATDAVPEDTTRTFVYDSTAPPAPTSLVPTGTIADNTPLLIWNAPTDPAPGTGIQNYVVTVIGATSFTVTRTVNNYPVSIPNTLNNGSHTWTVAARDNAGNLSPVANGSFIVDNTAPTQLTPAPNAATSDTSPDFTWSFKANASGYEFQLDNGPGVDPIFTNSDETFTLPAQAEGAYQWRIRYRDGGDDPSAWSPYRAFTIDTTNPSPPALVQTAGAFTRDSSPTFGWSGESGATFTWQVRNSSNAIIAGPADVQGNTSVTVPPLASNGFYTFQVFQTDAAGNQGDPNSAGFTLDTVAPAAPTLTSLPATPSTNPNPAFAWSAGEPGASFRWQVLNKDLQAIKNGSTGGTSVTVNALPAGNLRFRLWQVDRAGNASSITETAFIITNPKPPTKKPTANFIKPKTRNVKKLKPNVGSKISTATTILRWRKPTRDTVLYNVQVFRMNGRKLIKIHTAFPRGISYRLPAKLLRPNTRYVWQVWAYRGPEKGYQSKPIGITYFDKLKTRVRKKLLSPKANHVAGKKLVVRWRKAGKSRYYQLQVYRGTKRIVTRRVTKTRSTLAAKLLRPTSAKYRIIIRRGIGAPKNKKYVKKAYAGKSFKVVKPKKKK